MIKRRRSLNESLDQIDNDFVRECVEYLSEHACEWYLEKEGYDTYEEYAEWESSQGEPVYTKEEMFCPASEEYAEEIRDWLWRKGIRGIDDLEEFVDRIGGILELIRYTKASSIGSIDLLSKYDMEPDNLMISVVEGAAKLYRIGREY